MDSWLVALVTGGLTLVASLLTNFLSGRIATRNLRAQLQSEEHRQLGQVELERFKLEHQRQADVEARLFEHQRAAAVDFLAAMAAYSYSSAKMLGATYARSQFAQNRPGKLVVDDDIERISGHNVARTALYDALSAVSIYLPTEASTAARRASGLELAWVDSLRKHYEDDAEDPGAQPVGVDEALENFRRVARHLLGVDRSPVAR